MTAAGLPSLTDLTRARLEAAMVARGIPAYRARQVFQGLYRRGVNRLADMTDLPLALRQSLADKFLFPTPSIDRRDISDDGTQKFLLKLEDGKHIESVFIPDTPNQTFCLSTQVGCAVGCGFCLTATMGLVRNLTPGEIVGQVRVLVDALALRGTTFNVVLMGMGEPLLNYDHTMDALRILTDRYGFGMHPKRITLSTVGIVPAIERLAAEDVMPNLAISLHATTEDQRGSLVPINRKYGIADVLDACRRFPLARRERITFEYVLLDGVNDSPADAHRLARLLRDLQSKVNLIPLNPAPGIPYDRPSDDRIDAFGRILAGEGLTVSVRRSRGRDIRAACGQLAIMRSGREQNSEFRIQDSE